MTTALIGVVGLILLTEALADGAYVTELRLGLLLQGAGLTRLDLPAQVTARSDIGHADTGAASGIISTGYQVVGALGLVITSTLATAATTTLEDGTSSTAVLIDGYQRGLLLAAVLRKAILRPVRHLPSADPECGRTGRSSDRLTDTFQ